MIPSAPYWLPLDAPDSPMTLPGSSWLPFAPPGHLWLLLALGTLPAGSSWPLLVPAGSSWLPLALPLLALDSSKLLLLASPGSSLPLPGSSWLLLPPVAPLAPHGLSFKASNNKHMLMPAFFAMQSRYVTASTGMY